MEIYQSGQKFYRQSTNTNTILVYISYRVFTKWKINPCLIRQHIFVWNKFSLLKDLRFFLSITFVSEPSSACFVWAILYSIVENVVFSSLSFTKQWHWFCKVLQMASWHTCLFLYETSFRGNSQVVYVLVNEEYFGTGADNSKNSTVTPECFSCVCF